MRERRLRQYLRSFKQRMGWIRISLGAAYYCEEVNMEPDDLEPKFKITKPKNLEVLSIQALHEYILELEEEINRAREEISAKEIAREGAEAIFER